MSGTRIRPTTRWHAFVATALLAMAQAVPAITITFDYSLDSLLFFDLADPDGPDRRTALETAGAFFESRLGDSLSAITPNPGIGNIWTAGFAHPGTGASHVINNLPIAADEVLIFAGARDLTGSILGQAGPGSISFDGSPAFEDIVAARGQGLVSTPVATDFGPWGGGLTMDIDTMWHLGINTTPASGERDFLSVALHEIGHVLGIGTADSWVDMINGSNEFTGAASVAEFGGNIGLQASGSHWENGTSSFVANGPESYITNPGAGQETAMDPSINGTARKLFTDLDLVGLTDVGWEVSTPIPLPAGFWLLLSGTSLLLLRQRATHLAPTLAH